MNILTAERLRELLDYDPETGVFRWKVWRRGRAPAAGTIAGSLDAHGYVCIRVAGRTYKAHRLAWLYMTGEWPQHQIDHVNGKRACNTWTNLREATNAQNVCNGKSRVDSRSGIKGVRFLWGKNVWLARVRVAGKTRSKWCRSKGEAIEVVKALRLQAHGEFARHE